MDTTTTTTAQWPQGIGLVNKPLESSSSRSVLERSRARPQKDQALNCPRCSSTNTKFCYYNNYSLSQPRYFCKTCRRYWTEGGSLRNVPVGGGSRKNKRSSISSAPSSSSSPGLSKKLVDLTPPISFSQSASQNPKIHQGQDLNLAYPPADHHQDYSNISKHVEAPFDHTEENKTSTTAHHHHHVTAMELLKSTGITSRGFPSFMPHIPPSDHSHAIYQTGNYPLQELKPSLNFSLDGFESSATGFGSVQSTTGARLLFPVGDHIKQQVHSSTGFEQNRGQGESTGYWTGMLGGGSW